MKIEHVRQDKLTFRLSGESDFDTALKLLTKHASLLHRELKQRALHPSKQSRRRAKARKAANRYNHAK